MAKRHKFKHALTTIIISLAVMYIAVVGTLNVPYVQRKVTAVASRELSRLLRTDVNIERIDFGLLNRIIVHNATVDDRSGEEMLHVSRFSAKFELMPILQGQIRISNVQLFGLRASLNRQSPDREPNFKFFLDAFASKDTVKSDFDLDLRVNTVLIRRGQMKYDLLSAEETPGVFNSNHLDISNISATLSLKALNNDTINAQIRRMSMKEHSGLQLKKLTAKLRGNTSNFLAENIEISLPESLLSIDTIEAHYDSVPNFMDMGRDVTYRGKVHSHVIPKDIAAIMPDFADFSDTIFMRLAFHGQGNSASLEEFTIHNASEDMVVSARCTARDWQVRDSLFISGTVQRAELKPEGVGWLTRNLTGKEKVPAILKSNEFIRLYGKVEGRLNSLTVNGTVTTKAGVIDANGVMRKDERTGRMSYSGSAEALGLNLATLLNENGELGKATFDVELQGFSYQEAGAETYVRGVIDSIDIKGYRYHNIKLDGSYRPGAFNGQILLDDPNGSVAINGQFETRGRVPVYNLTASVTGFRPHDLHLTEKYEGTSFSMFLNADFSGITIDDFTGTLTVDSLTVDATDTLKCWYMDRLTLAAQKYEDGSKHVEVSSPFIKGDIRGDYSYTSLPKSVMNLLRDYIPSFDDREASKKKEKKKAKEEKFNNFTLSFKAENTDVLWKVLGVPLKLHKPATVTGFFNDEERRINLTANMPEFTYNGDYYESATVLCNNNEQRLECKLRVNKRMKKGATMSLAANATAEDERITGTVFWGNNTGNSYYGKASATAEFSKGEDGIDTHIDLHPSNIVLNDTVWTIHPSSIDIAGSGNIAIHDFLFEHGDNYIMADGVIGKGEEDSCAVKLNDIDVQYIIDMVQFKAVKFNGLASGDVMLRKVMSEPVIDIGLKVKGLALNDALLGDADIIAWWDNEVGGVQMDADIRQDSVQTTRARGYVSAKMNGLDLNIEAGRTNLSFLTPFMDGIFSGMKGEARGHVRLFGPFSDLDLDGCVSATASVKVDILNCPINAVADSVMFTPGDSLQRGCITFSDVRLTDNEGHTGMAYGTLEHNKLSELSYNFSFNANDMLVFNYSKETPEFPFYGRIYASGDVTLSGGDNRLDVTGSLTSGPKTTFTYAMTAALEAVSTQFITFVDKTPKREAEQVSTELYHHMNLVKEDDDDELESDIFINLSVQATPDATMKIIMDPIADDNISATGSGILQANYYNKGDFSMRGVYTVEQGLYKMSVQSVIRKDFSLQSGGTVTFDGDPRNANVDVNAVYTVNSASLDDLVADASSSKGSIRVNCIVNLSGRLEDPKLTFDLELPTVSDEDRELVRSLTNTEEQMNTQIIYLLGVGKFYTNDYSGNTSQSNATSSLALNTLSGQLNDILSDVIDNQNWRVGTNLSTGTDGWSDMEAEAILSGSLLNNRLVINGNFGYRDNPMRNTNFVGDFEALWLLTKNGELSLKGYNQTNDRYFTKSTLTTQGIGLMYKKDFTNWNELTAWLLKNRNKKKSQ